MNNQDQIILLDVGNTSVTYGISQKGRILSSGSCLYDEFPLIINKCYKSGKNSSIFVIIGSVVPQFNKFIQKEINKLPGVKSLFIGREIKVPIRSNYNQNKKLGQDRLITAYGVARIYGKPALIIDFGTAITFDLVSSSGAFEGGMIIPGPEISFQALIERAALLPKKMRLPKKAASFIGKTTYDCMTSGILQGFGAMTDELISRFQSKYGKSLKIVATGGFACHLRPFTKKLKVIDPQLSIKSLLMIYKNYEKNLKQNS